MCKPIILIVDFPIYGCLGEFIMKKGNKAPIYTLVGGFTFEF